MVVTHVRNRVSQHLRTACGVGAAKFADEGFDSVLLQPGGQRREGGIEGLCALNVGAGEVVIEVLVDIDGPVVGRILDLVEVIRARLVGASGSGVRCPCVAAGVAVTRDEN